MKLFEFAVLVHPTEEEKGASVELLGKPDYILAKDLESAEKKVYHGLDKNVDIDLIEVLVRPF